MDVSLKSNAFKYRNVFVIGEIVPTSGFITAGEEGDVGLRQKGDVGKSGFLNRGDIGRSDFIVLPSVSTVLLNSKLEQDIASRDFGFNPGNEALLWSAASPSYW